MDPLSRWPSVVILGTALMATLAAADICSKLKAGGIQVEEPFTLSYSIDLRRYWSAACGDLRPSCIVAPSSALEMSQVVKELHHFETLFAVKSGGHMPNNGFASIQDGLLISTKNLDQVLYSSDNQTAVIGPGLSWGNAQQGLRGTGRTLVGGRMAGVGVGGYMLGGILLPSGNSSSHSNMCRWDELPELTIRMGGEQHHQLRSGSGKWGYCECQQEGKFRFVLGK